MDSSLRRPFALRFLRFKVIEALEFTLVCGRYTVARDHDARSRYFGSEFSAAAPVLRVCSASTEAFSD